MSEQNSEFFRMAAEKLRSGMGPALQEEEAQKRAMLEASQLESLKRLADEERSRNESREAANIAASSIMQSIGREDRSPLSLDDRAQSNFLDAVAKLKMAQAGGSDGGLKDLLSMAKLEQDRAEEAGRSGRHGQNIGARYKGLELGQEKVDLSKEKMAQPSEKTASEFAKLETLKSEMDLALGELEEQEGREDLNLPATGLLRNLVEGSKGLLEEVGLANPDADLGKLKATIAGFSAEKLREKFGSQVTVNEMDKVKPYIPLPGDTPTVVKTKIKNLRREVDKIIEDRTKKLEASGRRFKDVPQEAPQEAPAKTVAPKSENDLEKMTDEELEAYLNEGK